jgi:hypothetical protein
VSAIIQADGDDIAFSLNQTVPSGATPASGFGFIRNGDSITVSPSDVAHISFRNKNNAAASVHIYYR